MAITVLVVHPQPTFLPQLRKKLAIYQTEIDFTIVDSRLTALTAMQRSPYQFLITSLKIPRLSDGYRFLSQVAGKEIDTHKILAIVDEKTSGVNASLTSLGIHHLAAVTDIDEMVGTMAPNLGSPLATTPRAADRPSDISPSTEKMQRALNQVMGPAGSIIFRKVLPRWNHTESLEDLAKIIAREIGEGELSDQFLDYWQKYR